MAETNRHSQQLSCTARDSVVMSHDGVQEKRHSENMLAQWEMSCEIVRLGCRWILEDQSWRTISCETVQANCCCGRQCCRCKLKLWLQFTFHTSHHHSALKAALLHPNKFHQHFRSCSCCGMLLPWQQFRSKQLFVRECARTATVNENVC